MIFYNIEDFGAIADGKTLATDAINKAIDEAHNKGGGTVVVPSGTFHTGSILLKSNVELHLTPGALLSFSTNPDDYPVVNSRWEGVEREVHRSCIYAEDATNIAVTGFGKINGNGKPWWVKKRENPDALIYPRPKTISFERSENITIKDISIVDSPTWTINPIKCHNITVDNVNIKNPKDSPNTDGVNPESCTNVRIVNCNIDVGDDCIAIKAGVEDTPTRVSCENITISNCTMVHGHGGVVIGSEMSGSIRNVTISNCVFQDTDRGIRIKSRRGRGGTVEDIRVSNIVMDNVFTPFVLNLYYFCGPRGKEKYVWDKNPYPITEETPYFRRIHFANITARNVNASAGFFYGLAERYLEEITFSNIDISMKEDATPEKPAMMSGIEDMTHRGFFLGNCSNMRFDHITLENVAGPAFTIETSDNIEIENVKEIRPKDEAELIVYK